MAYFETGWRILLVTAEALSLLLAFYYLVRTASNKTPAADKLPRISVNPLNVIGYPEYLTERGRIYRRRCLIAVTVFVLTVALGWLTGPVELHL